MDVASTSVRVSTGACIINSRASGGGHQSYVGRNIGQDVIPISATGSSAGRSDLIVARVEDPFMAGEQWEDPSDVTRGPYIFTRVIPNVPANTTTAPSGSSAIALARIDIPPNTGTINTGMIKDLRRLAQPRSATITVGGVPNSYTHYVGQTEQGDPFGMARVSDVNPFVDIPAWATEADIVAQFINPDVDPNVLATGAALVKLGSGYGPHINFRVSQASSTIFTAALALPVRAMAGTRRDLSFRIRLDGGPLKIPDWAYIVFTVTFRERVV